MRHDWQGRCVVTAHNLAKRAATARVDVGDGPGTELRDLLQPGAPIRVRDGRARIPLTAHGHRWFRLTTSLTRQVSGRCGQAMSTHSPKWSLAWSPVRGSWKARDADSTRPACPRRMNGSPTKT